MGRHVGQSLVLRVNLAIFKPSRRNISRTNRSKYRFRVFLGEAHFKGHQDKIFHALLNNITLVTGNFARLKSTEKLISKTLKHNLLRAQKMLNGLACRSWVILYTSGWEKPTFLSRKKNVQPRGHHNWKDHTCDSIDDSQVYGGSTFGTIEIFSNDPVAALPLTSMTLHSRTSASCRSVRYFDALLD